MIYNPSAKLTEAECLYVNFNFEILNGCKFKCAGCFVDTEGQSAIDETQSRQLSNLIGDMIQSKYVPAIAFLGPTDFLVASNTAQSLTDPKMVTLLRRFKRLSLQTTLLDTKNVDSISAAINQYYSDMEIEINIIINPTLVNHEKYLSKIKAEKDQLQAAIKAKEIQFFGLMNVFNYGSIHKGNFLRDYDYFQVKLEPLFQETVDYYSANGQDGAPFLDFNFSAGRSRECSPEEFLALADQLKETFNESIVEGSQAPYLRFSFGKLTDSLLERQFNYRHGKLYVSPYFYERFVGFQDELSVPLNKYTAQEVEDFENKFMLHQYEYAASTAECSTCDFLSSCVERGVIGLMKIYGFKNCLVAKKALLMVNSVKSSDTNNMSFKKAENVEQ